MARQAPLTGSCSVVGGRDRRPLVARVATLTVATALLACTRGAVEREAEPRTTTMAIQGGSDDTTSGFAVVVLGNKSETCSGTLLAPNLVMTARHCVSDLSAGTFVDCKNDAFTTVHTTDRLRVATTAAAPAFADAPYAVSKILVPSDLKFCGNDIALLILDAKVPASDAQPAIPALDATDIGSYGKSITGIGYGRTAPTTHDDDTRRRRGGIPVECIPGDGSGCEADFPMTSKEFAVGAGLCAGDSGSGAFVTVTLTNGSATVIGALSRSFDDGTSCIESIYTRTDAFADFLVSGALEAASAGGYTAPSWTVPKTKDAGVTADATAPVVPEQPAPDASAPEQTAAAPSESSGCDIGRDSRASGRNPLGVLLALALVFGARRATQRGARSTNAIAL